MSFLRNQPSWVFVVSFLFRQALSLLSEIFNLAKQTGQRALGHLSSPHPQHWASTNALHIFILWALEMELSLHDVW